MSGAPQSVAELGARVVRLAYANYRRRFQEITHRARWSFEQCDWTAGQLDATERLELYGRVLNGMIRELRTTLGERAREPATWVRMKAAYAGEVGGFEDVELAHTFFNSATRRMLGTVGVDTSVEFAAEDAVASLPISSSHRSYAPDAGIEDAVSRILDDFHFSTPYRDREEDVRSAAARVEATWREKAEADVEIERIDVIDSMFYRGTAAYLVARIRGGGRLMPLVIAFLNTAHGIEVDAVLMTASDVSIVFSFTRSHFHVELDNPGEAVQFLSSIMPMKPIAELYIALGHNKHGKTRLFRDLQAHLHDTSDRFDFAPGAIGMVMIVFGLPSHSYVFKVIRDQFAPPKQNTRQEVMERYQLVFRHDRAGRLVEAQEFEALRFERHLFSDDLLEELVSSASKNVTLEDDLVVIHHVYVERRVRPLDLYLREMDGAAAAGAVLDYGQAIRDLATTNIFPGDLLLKNFGVTRHGRVIFYDYDELCLVTECRFRDIPEPRDEYQEMSGEPWYFVDDKDVFPEEFIQFLELTPAQRQLFLSAHKEVLTSDFWRTLQKRHENRDVLEVFPYPPNKRLK